MIKFKNSSSKNKMLRLKNKIGLRQINRSPLGISMVQDKKIKKLLKFMNKYSRRIQGNKAITDWKKLV